VQEHNGRIDVSSKLGEGTSITVSIPALQRTPSGSFTVPETATMQS
jgi:signal transduction histidine kinase